MYRYIQGLCERDGVTERPASGLSGSRYNRPDEGGERNPPPSDIQSKILTVNLHTSA